AAITSTNLDCSSSISSQCTSMGTPYSSARSKIILSEATPSSGVPSLCGMPPITSAPSRVPAREAGARRGTTARCLRKGDNLDLDPILDVLAQLKDGFQRCQLWIGDVSV